MSENDEFVFDTPALKQPTVQDNIQNEPTSMKVMTKHRLVELESELQPAKRTRIVAQQELVEDVDNAPELTEYLREKTKHLVAEQAGKIKSSLEEIKAYKTIGLRLGPEMREIEATIMKIDNKDAFNKIPPEQDVRRLAHFNITSPYEVRATQILGKSRIQDKCFGCHNEVGMPKLDSKITEKFQRFLIDTFLSVDWIEAAKQCAEYYKEYVQGSVEDGEKLPDWTARDIYDHMKSHQSHEPTKRRLEIMRLEELMDIIYNNDIFTVNPEIMKIGHRSADVSDIQVDRKAVKVWSDLLAQRTRLAEGNPKKFLFVNEHAPEEQTVPPLVRKNNPMRQLTLPSLFKPECG
jgi:hypothetical protein